MSSLYRGVLVIERLLLQLHIRRWRGPVRARVSLRRSIRVRVELLPLRLRLRRAANGRVGLLTYPLHKALLLM